MHSEEQSQELKSISNNKKNSCNIKIGHIIVYVIVFAAVVFLVVRFIRKYIEKTPPVEGPTPSESEIVTPSEVYDTEVVEDTPPLGADETPLPPNEETVQPTEEEATHTPTKDPTKIPNTPTLTAVPTNVKTRIEDSNFYHVDNDYYEFNFAGSPRKIQSLFFSKSKCYYLPEKDLIDGLIEFEFNDEDNTIIERSEADKNKPLKCSINYLNEQAQKFTEIQSMIFFIEIQPLIFDDVLLVTKEDQSPVFIVQFNCIQANEDHEVTFYLTRKEAYYKTVDYDKTNIWNLNNEVHDGDHLLLILKLDLSENSVDLYREINEQTFLNEDSDNLVMSIKEKITDAFGGFYDYRVSSNNLLNCNANENNLKLQFGIEGIPEKGVRIKVYTFIVESEDSIKKDYFNFQYPEPLLPAVSTD